jgi:hypothetical protein
MGTIPTSGLHMTTELIPEANIPIWLLEMDSSSMLDMGNI